MSKEVVIGRKNIVTTTIVPVLIRPTFTRDEVSTIVAALFGMTPRTDTIGNRPEQREDLAMRLVALMAGEPEDKFVRRVPDTTERP